MSITIPLALLEAYFATHYRVFADSGAFTLRVGERSEALAALHSMHGVSTSAFVTPCNPFGARWSKPQNEAVLLELCSSLDAQGIPWIPGEGVGVGDDWPPEPSVLALGVSEADARSLCSDWEQNAVVWNSMEATPALLLHPHAVLTHAITEIEHRTNQQLGRESESIARKARSAEERLTDALGAQGIERGVQAFSRSIGGLCHRTPHQRVRAIVAAALGDDT